MRQLVTIRLEVEETHDLSIDAIRQDLSRSGVFLADEVSAASIEVARAPQPQP